MQDNGDPFQAASRTPRSHDMLPKSKHISTQYQEGGKGEPLVGGDARPLPLYWVGAWSRLGRRMMGVDPGPSK